MTIASYRKFHFYSVLSFCLTLFSITTSPSNAQGFHLPENMLNEKADMPELEIQDSTCHLECIYAFSEVDSILGKGRNHELILQIGTSFSKFYDYGKYQQDSVVTAHNYDMTWAEVQDACNKYHYTYRKTFARNEDTFYGRQYLSMAALEYEDTNVEQNWNLLDDSCTICGYLCHKAIVTFRGRVWNVWYTEDIATDCGPWKLHGLPGLILKATDENSLHDFEAVAIRPAATRNIYREKEWNRIKRTNFRKRELAIATDYNDETSKSGLVNSVSASTERRGFYSPLELE